MADIVDDPAAEFLAREQTALRELNDEWVTNTEDDEDHHEINEEIDEIAGRVYKTNTTSIRSMMD